MHMQTFKNTVLKNVSSQILRKSFTSSKQTIRAIISQSDVEKFAKISGDSNPLHTDKEYASRSIFKQRISHGMLPMGFIEEYFSQHNMKIKKMEIKFIRPIYLQEEILIDIKVSNQEDYSNGQIGFVAEIKKMQKSSQQSEADRGSLTNVTLITGEVERQN